MSWNCAIAVVPGITSADLSAIGIVPVGEPVVGEESVSMGFDGVAAVDWDGDVVLTSSDLSLQDGLAELSTLLDRTVCCATFAGVSDTWIIESHSPTASRMLAWQDGAVVMDQGVPLDAERDLVQLDEDSLFALLQAVTGFQLDDRFMAAMCQPVSWPPGARDVTTNQPSGTPKRRWFRR